MHSQLFLRVTCMVDTTVVASHGNIMFGIAAIGNMFVKETLQGKHELLLIRCT